MTPELVRCHTLCEVFVVIAPVEATGTIAQSEWPAWDLHQRSRKLRQRASELLRQVERGETVQITDRGRPVALLSPMPDAGPMARLRESGASGGAGSGVGTAARRTAAYS